MKEQLDDTTDGPRDPNIIDASRRQGLLRGTPAQEAELSLAAGHARTVVQQLRYLDPNWRGPQSAYSNIQGQIEHFRDVAREAQARYAEITQGAVPGFNPAWGRDRLVSELHDRGFILRGETRGPGLMYVNPSTGERIRIMEQPSRRYRSEPDWKHTFEYYYRYRSPGQGEGGHVPIPD